MGPNKDVSLYLESDQNVVAERPMYFDYRQGAADDTVPYMHVVVNGNSLLFPVQGLCPDLDDPRNAAITEVLRRIPATDFQTLEELVESFTWVHPCV